MMNELSNNHIRNSRMFLNEVYFWTDTIKDWKYLLNENRYKDLIIEQLQWLKKKGKINVYGFVIMPNHMHIIWEMVERNGKEMPYASFNKWTSSQFLKELRISAPSVLPQFIEITNERNHRFWQRDPLAILMDTKDKLEQKLEYIHLNPLQDHWNLVTLPDKYLWSSSKFYETGIDDFGFLTHYMERF